MDGTPKLDRERYLQEMRAQVEAVLLKVADAVNNAAPGRVITDSEEPAREAFAQFREAAYSHAVQMRLDAAEAAFSPSAARVIRAGRSTRC
jgi:hypothetical protein